MISSSWEISIALPVSFRKFVASPRLFEETGTWSKFDLVHEDVVVTVAVEILGVALVDDRLFEALVRAVRALDDRPGAGVAQLGAHEGAALAGLDVLELDHGEEAVVDLDGDAVFNVRSGDGGHGPRNLSRLVRFTILGNPPASPTRRRPACSARRLKREVVAQGAKPGDRAVDDSGQAC